MDERNNRIAAAKILQGIVKSYMNPVRHMTADDESFAEWMRIVDSLDKEYASNPFFEQVLLSLTAEGYLPGGKSGLGYQSQRELLSSQQIEDIMKEFYNSVLERNVGGVRYSLQSFEGKYTGSGVIFPESLINAYSLAYRQNAN